MTDTNTREFSAMLLPELKKLAAAKGIPGATTMKKADLIAALSGGIELKDVLHADPHAADAGPAAALVRVVGDAAVHG